jgi:hypothetical protein
MKLKNRPKKSNELVGSECLLANKKYIRRKIEELEADKEIKEYIDVTILVDQDNSIWVKNENN